MEKMKQYHLLAELFRYPGKGYRKYSEEVGELLAEAYPKASKAYQRFREYMASHDLHQIEEVYAKTFHIQAICYLDLGYVLFGEDYKRGEFLVHMKDEQNALGNDCGNELPDNLANVLELLSLHKDENFLNELAKRVLHPALKKMEAEFETSRMELRRKVLLKKHRALILDQVEGGNIYRNAIQALRLVIERDFAGIEYEPLAVQPAISQSFLKNCGPSGCGPSLGSPEAQMGMGPRRNRKH